MENHHFNGKIHYKWPFSIAMFVHQRVNFYDQQSSLQSQNWLSQEYLLGQSRQTPYLLRENTTLSKAWCDPAINILIKPGMKQGFAVSTNIYHKP